MFIKILSLSQETSHAVMTALLINDLRDKKSVANPNTKLRNPLELFASGGFHGGVWRTGLLLILFSFFSFFNFFFKK